VRTLLVTLLLLVPALAAADAVEGPPSSCPPGSSPSSAHTGPYCRQTDDCTSDAACGGVETCEPVMQCIETRACGGRAPPDAAPCTLRHVVGPCADDGACAVGTCQARDVCTGETESGGDDGGCGCRVGARDSGAGAALALVAVALLAWRRSR